MVLLHVSNKVLWWNYGIFVVVVGSCYLIVPLIILKLMIQASPAHLDSSWLRSFTNTYSGAFVQVLPHERISDACHHRYTLTIRQNEEINPEYGTFGEIIGKFLSQISIWSSINKHDQILKLFFPPCVISINEPFGVKRSAVGAIIKHTRPLIISINLVLRRDQKNG